MLRTIVASLAALALAPAAIHAHHSYAGFDETPVTIEAVVVSFQWTNPHTLIELRTKDDERYVVVWGAPNALARQGYTRSNLLDVLRPGERLMVTGRARRGEAVTPLLPQQMEHPVHGVLFARGR